MSWKSNRVSMPMTSAGIIGMSADVQIAGIAIDPKSIIIATLIFVGVVKLLGILI